MADALQFSLFVAKIPLGLLIQLHGLFKTGLDLNVDALQLFVPLLQLPSRSIGLLKVDDQDLNLEIRRVNSNHIFLASAYTGL